MTQIHLYIRFYTRFGESLSVTGDLPELGMGEAAKAKPLQYLDKELWHTTLEVDPATTPEINYSYIFYDKEGVAIPDGEQRRIKLQARRKGNVQVLDTWNRAGEFENAFYTGPFRDVLLNQAAGAKSKPSTTASHRFKVKAPLLSKDQVICLLGEGDALTNWNLAHPVLMSRRGDWWVAELSIPGEQLSLHYKYGVYNKKKKTFERYEVGGNRFLFQDNPAPSLTILHDGFVHLPNDTWRGAGVAIPVFSLRSKDSFGVGEFTDIKPLVDWAKKTGLQLIQLLPVNDTTVSHTWADTYPYSAISAFAMHPMYINLEGVAGRAFASLIKPLKKKQKQLNELPDMEYEEVMNIKWPVLKELFVLQQETLAKDEAYQQFFEDNKDWLVPYAAFCYLRDRNGTADFTKWKQYSKYNKLSIDRLVSPRGRQYSQVAIHYFVQYHLHKQLKEATAYAHKNGVIIKGDIAIGVARHGSETWQAPGLFHMEMQAGAPPDDFAVKGQNWSFPTYNWAKMEEDHFAWWKRRFVQMGHYFDAFRIDHILGFFRIWSVPLDAVEGIMGHFVPAIPVGIHEFGERNLWFDYERYCTPFITDGILWEMFGPNKDKFQEYLVPVGDGRYRVKEAFDTQRKVDDHFNDLPVSEDNNNLRSGLFDLLSNILLIEHPGSEKQGFHFRIDMLSTASFRHLQDHLKEPLKALYYDYFFHRQDEAWRKEAMKKLPALQHSTDMLICGEDLGMVPHCVPAVMQQLGILSLEIQRMPKTLNQEFSEPSQAPYLSVVSPSTHDMSTIRGWWEEDRNRTQRFYNNILGMEGEAPKKCTVDICQAVISRHLHSPAMWSIFQLQDLMGMQESLWREDPAAERINVPANPKHYWKYRMQLTLEQLAREKEFNHRLSDMLKESDRLPR